MAALAMGLIGGGTSLISGILGARAATKAAKIQAEAAEAAAERARLVGKEQGALVRDAASDSARGVGAAADFSGQQVINASDVVNPQIRAEAERAAAGVRGGATRAMDLLNPYAEAGADASRTLQAGVAPGGDFNRAFTEADLQMDPGFDFRMKEGLKAIQASGARGAGGGGGGVLKAATRYSSDYASSEFGKAFDRYRTTTQDRFGNLNTVAGRGQVAATEQGDDLTEAERLAAGYGIDATGATSRNTLDAQKQAAGYSFDAAKIGGDYNYGGAVRSSDYITGAERIAGDYSTDAARATAGGIVGRANAIGGALGGVSRAATDYAILDSLSNPATASRFKLPKLRAPRMSTDFINPN